MHAIVLALLQAAAPPLSLGERLLREPLVVLYHGDITIDLGTGPNRITRDGRNRSVVASPDGRLLAFIHQDVLPRQEGDPGETSLQVAAVVSGELRQVLAPAPSDDPRRDMRAFDRPHWGLDGQILYVEAAAWASSPAVHQVRLASASERYVVDGRVYGIVQNGPYRGNLLVRRRHVQPGGGAYVTVDLVQPDGTIVFQIDGSAEDGGQRSVPKWLAANGWSAS